MDTGTEGAGADRRDGPNPKSKFPIPKSNPMNLNERKHHLRRAALRSLDDCGPYLCPEEALLDSIGIKAEHHNPTRTEMAATLRGIEAERLATALPSECGRKWSLTDAGRHWLAQNG
jgi:hypothetical protein